MRENQKSFTYIILYNISILTCALMKLELFISYYYYKLAVSSIYSIAFKFESRFTSLQI